jgi:hypothetical protein
LVRDPLKVPNPCHIQQWVFGPSMGLSLTNAYAWFLTVL